MGNEGMEQLFMSYEIIVLHSSAKRVFMFAQLINEFRFFPRSIDTIFNEWDFWVLTVSGDRELCCIDGNSVVWAAVVRLY